MAQKKGPGFLWVGKEETVPTGPGEAQTLSAREGTSSDGTGTASATQDTARHAWAAVPATVWDSVASHGTHRGPSGFTRTSSGENSICFNFEFKIINA